MEITPEIRRQVMIAECKRLGHDVDLGGVFSWRPTGGQDLNEDPEADQLPRLQCTRCEMVLAIIIPTHGYDYESAEATVYAMLRPEHALAKRIVRNLGKRRPEVPRRRPDDTVSAPE
jgi:hypothetical protein